MKIFKAFFQFIWKIFDLLMFLASAITVNLTTYYQEHIAFGISMTITFILAGLLSEIMSGHKND